MQHNRIQCSNIVVVISRYGSGVIVPKVMIVVIVWEFLMCVVFTNTVYVGDCLLFSAFSELTKMMMRDPYHPYIPPNWCGH